MLIYSVQIRLADRVPEAEGNPPLPKTFQDDEPGFAPVDGKDLPRMPDEAEHRDLSAAIDRASRGVCVELQPDQSAATAAGGWAAWSSSTPIE